LTELRDRLITIRDKVSALKKQGKSLDVAGSFLRLLKIVRLGQKLRGKLVLYLSSEKVQNETDVHRRSWWPGETAAA
jgi:hypothetical protein